MVVSKWYSQLLPFKYLLPIHLPREAAHKIEDEGSSRLINGLLTTVAQCSVSGKTVLFPLSILINRVGALRWSLFLQASCSERHSSSQCLGRRNGSATDLEFS
jgi:hypothetical protein